MKTKEPLQKCTATTWYKTGHPFQKKQNFFNNLFKNTIFQDDKQNSET